MHRRTLIQWMIAGAAAWPLRGVRLHAQAAALPDHSVATLRALAPAVLPSELGAGGHDRIAGDFIRWLASYRSGAERSWGYGRPRKTSTAPIDTSSYQAQLREIEDGARARGGPLASLPLDTRRTLAAAALESVSARTLPGSPDGRHVITDFMSFYFTSSAANDLCYRARIGRDACRGLAGATTRPVPLDAG
jgi:hypothetical protein